MKKLLVGLVLVTAALAQDPVLRTAKMGGYKAIGTGGSGVLVDADITAVGFYINDAVAKTLVEASCVSDAGDQTVTVKIGATTLFAIHCLAAASYSRSTTNGTTGYIIAASMTNTAVAAGALLDLSGTANTTTKNVTIHLWGKRTP